MITNLGISIEKLLTLDKLRHSKILAGNSGINNKITKVNVMEVPDIVEWVSEGEFLITTAYSIRDNIEILCELIPKLKAKGVVGLGLKVGRYVTGITQNIIDIADKMIFPIIEIPFNISHTDIISDILSEVLNDQTKILIDIDNFNKEVMDIMIRNGSLGDIVKKLSDYLGNTVGIYENISDTCELSFNDKDNYVYKDIIYKFIGDKCAYKNYYKNSDNINGKQVKRYTIPILVNNIEYGDIFIWIDKREITAIDNIMIESYLNIIVLEFAKKIALYNIQSNYKLEFFDDLLSDNTHRQKRAIEKAKNYDFNKENKYCVIVLLLKEWDENESNNLQEEISKLMFIINRVIRKHKNSIICTEKSDRILILYGNNESIDSEIIKNESINLCKQIYAEAIKLISTMELLIGIGRSYSETNQLYKSNKQANLIVEQLSKGTTQSIVHYDNLGIYRILAYDGLKAELIDFCRDTITPLINYDKEYNSELVKTLKQYFKYNGNVKKISEKMYMHYNTISYRLNKIKDITGLDIDDSDCRLNLQIALKILDIINIE